MAELSTTSQWVQFFKDSGLPTSVSGNYAIIFVENRIQLDMLMDLSKEYLYDMGIRVMGDVIAILKHAKEYHTELTKQRMITDVRVTPQRNSPATRMLGRLTKPSASSDRVQSRLSLPKVSAHSLVTTQTHKEIEVKPSVIALKKRLGNPIEIEAKRVRRVPPEEEGGYQIKMPSGSTERSRKLLQQQGKAGLKVSVFDRLGDAAVSSSTDILKSKTKPSSSVFERLGSNSEVSTSTMSSGKNLLLSDQPLQYQGVLKTDIAKIRPITSSPKVTIKRTINPEVTIARRNRIVLNSAKEGQVFSGISRINKMLERNTTDRPLSTAGRIRLQSKSNPSEKRVSVNRSVLSRLGTSGAATTVTKPAVIDRLGSKFGDRPHVSVFSRLGT